MAESAKQAGADMLGFVFAPSRRRIGVQEAAAITGRLKGIASVGVFVNTPLAMVQETAERCKLDWIQLHGDESAAYCRQVGRPVIKAVRADWLQDEALVTLLKHHPAEWLLWDSVADGQFGGSGTVCDWQGLQAVRAQFKKPLLLAGGLHEQNVGQAIRLLQPNGVDVSSGVEAGGKKSIPKIYGFVAAVRKEAIRC